MERISKISPIAVKSNQPVPHEERSFFGVYSCLQNSSQFPSPRGRGFLNDEMKKNQEQMVLARELRRRQTNAEKALWMRLRERNLHKDFYKIL